MNAVLQSALILVGVGLVFGLLIALAHAKFKVFEDPRISGVTEMLPGTNCGACGFAGCQGFAEGLVEGAAPPVNGFFLDGTPLLPEDLRGRPVLLHFWATWCPICALENRYLEDIARDHRVITVAMHSGGAGEVAAYLSEHGLDFPVIVDPAGDLAAVYGVSAVPASFVLDGEGMIRFAETGLTSPWGLRLRLWLAGY